MHAADAETDSTAPWHSPERAWAPLMWIIGGVVLVLSAMVVAPLVPLALAVL
jgi:hypothetical protein